MASKAVTTIVLLLTLNLLFFTLVSSNVPCPPPPPPNTPKCNCQNPPPPPPQPKTPNSPPNSPPTTQKSPPATPKSPPTPTKPTSTCPVDTLKLGVCADLLNGLVHIVVGSPSKTPCCSLLGGLVDLDAAVCLCTAIKANILGIHLNVPISLSLLLNNCGKNVPNGFQCA